MCPDALTKSRQGIFEGEHDSIGVLLVACRSEQKPLPPSDEASQARVMVTGTGLFKVTPDALVSLGWNDETPFTLTMN